MPRLHATLALSSILGIVSVSAQTVTTQTPTLPITQESFAPTPRSFLFSAGPVIVSDRIDAPSVKTGSTKTGYGGYVALDYFLTRALSLRSEVSVTSLGGETNIIATLVDHGTLKTLLLHIPSRTEVRFDIGARFSPLQLTEYANFRLQPFVKVALGGAFYVIPDGSPGISIDPCPFISAGGGADIALSARWSATAEADYYSSISNTTLHTQGVQLTTRNDGIFATVGIRYQF